MSWIRVKIHKCWKTQQAKQTTQCRELLKILSIFFTETPHFGWMKKSMNKNGTVNRTYFMLLPINSHSQILDSHTSVQHFFEKMNVLLFSPRDLGFPCLFSTLALSCHGVYMFSVTILKKCLVYCPHALARSFFMISIFWSNFLSLSAFKF